MLLQRTVNQFGTTVIGAFAATTQVEILVEQFYSTLGTTMATYTAQNIGAKKYERIEQALRCVLIICAAVSALWLFFALLGGNQIMRIFVDDTAMTDIAATGIRITAVFFMAFGTTNILRRLSSQYGVIKVLKYLESFKQLPVWLNKKYSYSHFPLTSKM